MGARSHQRTLLSSPTQSPSPYSSDTPHPAPVPGNGNRRTSPLHTIQSPPTLRASAPAAPQSFPRTGTPTPHSPRPGPLLQRLSRPVPHHDPTTFATRP